MKSATLHNIKKELESCSQQKAIELIIKLARFKTENKELLSYLLFDSNNKEAYIKEIKEEISHMMSGIKTENLYLAKKSIRKILRIINRYCKYMGSKESEAELLIFFCKIINESGLPVFSVKALTAIYVRQIEKISRIIHLLHEDLQYDYKLEVNLLSKQLNKP